MTPTPNARWTDSPLAQAIPWLGVLAILAVTVYKSVPVGMNDFAAPTYEASKARPSDENYLRAEDFVHYFRAAQAAQRGDNIYTSWRGGYVYPPLLAAMLTVLTPLGLQPAAWVWYSINIAVLIACGWLAFKELTRRWRLRLNIGDLGTMLFMFLGVFFVPICNTLGLGQADPFVLLGLTLALVFAGRSDRPSHHRDSALAGFGLAFAAHVKFVAIGLVAYYLLTRQWKVLSWTIGAFVALTLCTAPLFGWSLNLEYQNVAWSRVLHVIGLPAPSYGMFDPHPVEWLRSRSILSGLARWFLERGSPVKYAYFGAAALGVLWAGIAFVQYARAGVNPVKRLLSPRTLDPGLLARLFALEWCSVVAAIVALGPQTTKRHAIIYLPAVLLAAMLALKSPSATGRKLLWLSLAVTGVAMWLPAAASFHISGPADLWQAAGAAGGLGWSIAVLSLVLTWTGLRQVKAA